MDLSTGALLLYGGIAVVAITAIAAIVAAVLFRFAKVRLQAQLEREFGKKRH